MSAEIQDQNEIINATLFYSVNASAWVILEMNKTVPFTNSGRDPISGNLRSL